MVDFLQDSKSLAKYNWYVPGPKFLSICDQKCIYITVSSKAFRLMLGKIDVQSFSVIWHIFWNRNLLKWKWNSRNRNWTEMKRNGEWKKIRTLMQVNLFIWKSLICRKFPSQATLNWKRFTCAAYSSESKTTDNTIGSPLVSPAIWNLSISIPWCFRNFTA
jgi:hypothetical protein